MKQSLTLFLALAFLLTLGLTGCGSRQPSPQSSAPAPDSSAASPAAPSAGNTPAAPADASQSQQQELEVEPLEPSGSLAGQTGGGSALPGISTEPTGEAPEYAGKERIEYTDRRSAVRYVTSPADLPDCEGLRAYDEAWFQSHALLLVTETVSSGSVAVGIASVDPETGAVTLSHERTGDVGTADMATWLLWAEVEPGLEGVNWTVANPALASDSVAY